MSANIESNISLYYESLVADYADTANRWMRSQEGDEQEYGYDYDENNAVDRTISDQFIRYVDEAYVLAHAYTEGLVKWGEPVQWSDIMTQFKEDVYNELMETRSKQ